MRVPTIWRVPGGVSGAVREDMVSTVDLCPTILQLAGVDVPEGVQGRSYAGLLSGEDDSVARDRVYIEYERATSRTGFGRFGRRTGRSRTTPGEAAACYSISRTIPTSL